MAITCFKYSFSSITVYIRDLEYFVNVLMMLWFYVTPVVYSIDMIPKKFQFLFQLNPMTQIITAYREILYYKQVPDILNLIILFVLCLALLVVGYLIFNKCEKRFAEEL